MQQKRGYFSAKYFILATIVIVGGLMAALMLVNIPAPNQPVEKELDAKAFLQPHE